jgi:hypothetical protein
MGGRNGAVTFFVTPREMTHDQGPDHGEGRPHRTTGECPGRETAKNEPAKLTTVNCVVHRNLLHAPCCATPTSIWLQNIFYAPKENLILIKHLSNFQFFWGDIHTHKHTHSYICMYVCLHTYIHT